MAQERRHQVSNHWYHLHHLIIASEALRIASHSAHHVLLLVTYTSSSASAQDLFSIPRAEGGADGRLR